MEIFKEILKQAGIVPKLKLFTKENDKKPPVSTGAHKVKVLSAKTIKEIDSRTKKEVIKIELLLEKDGEKRSYKFPVKGQNGKPHYLVEKLADVKEEEEILLEGKNEHGRSFVRVSRVADTGEYEEDLPTIDHEDSTEDFREELKAQGELPG